MAERAAGAYLIGETAAELRAALEPTGVPIAMSGDLEHAVAAARAAAHAGDVVLLSPACASYDQYRSFEERGEHFRALVGRDFVSLAARRAARALPRAGGRPVAVGNL